VVRLCRVTMLDGSLATGLVPSIVTTLYSKGGLH
jgi:hypothetical protein